MIEQTHEPSFRRAAPYCRKDGQEDRLEDGEALRAPVWDELSARFAAARALRGAWQADALDGNVDGDLYAAIDTSADGDRRSFHEERINPELSVNCKPWGTYRSGEAPVHIVDDRETA
ncbi:MAG: hypothetical protein WA948_12005 [Pontixanthobacter sp.]